MIPAEDVATPPHSPSSYHFIYFEEPEGEEPQTALVKRDVMIHSAQHLV